MGAESPAEEWAGQVRFYAARGQSDLAWPGAGGYLRLVEAIAASRFAAGLHAVRSLDRLIVTPTRGWVSRGPKWVDRPRVLLQPLLAGRVAVVAVGFPPGWSREVACEYADAWAVVEPRLAWLLDHGLRSRAGE